MARCKIRARLVSLSNCEKMIVWRSLSPTASWLKSSSNLSDSARTRSTTRPKRAEVDRIILPQAEIKTAGVIIAVKTATAEVIASIRLEHIYRLSAGEAQIRCGKRKLAPLPATRVGKTIEKRFR